MWQQTLCLLSVIITGSLSVNWDMVISPEVTVSRGQDIVLNCSFTHPNQQKYSGLITVKWLAQARGQFALHFFNCSLRNDSTSDHSGCSGSAVRYSLTGDPRRGELSLLIRKVQLMDNGRYFCRVELQGWRSYEKHTELHVTAEPQILNLSVVGSPSGPYGAPHRLQCEVEGHPLPKIGWRLPSRYKMMGNQVLSHQSGPYQVTSSVPYLEEGEELTCRAENEMGGAERTYPPRSSLVITLVVRGVIVLLLLSAGMIVACWSHRVKPRSDCPDGGAIGLELVPTVQ